MEELLKEIRVLREEVAGLRQDIRNQAQASARALSPLCMTVAPGERVSLYEPEPPLGSPPNPDHMACYNVGSNEPFVLRMRGTTDPSHTAIGGERSASGDAPRPS